jgi:hypothetical protein
VQLWCGPHPRIREADTCQGTVGPQHALLYLPLPSPPRACWARQNYGPGQGAWGSGWTEPCIRLLVCPLHAHWLSRSSSSGVTQVRSPHHQEPPPTEAAPGLHLYLPCSSHSSKQLALRFCLSGFKEDEESCQKK